jgi:hypothetical protein
MVGFYALASIATFFAETRGSRRAALRTALVVLLAAGAAWQLVDLVRFVRAPFPQRHRWVYTMPFADSQADYMVETRDVDWLLELRARAQAGETLLLVYDLGAYDENYTNPSASLERLYLYLGHDAFVRTVFAFGSTPCRHACVPVRPMAELGPFLDSLEAGTGPALATLTGYWVVEQPYDTPQFTADRRHALDELRRRFAVTVETPLTAKYHRFRLAPRSP